MEYNIIAGIACKNEEWIIDKTLKTLSTFCTKIIIVDDTSTDRTAEICLSYPKVDFYVRKRDNILCREEGKYRQYIIDKIQPYNPDYVIFLDADEVISPNIANFFKNIDTTVNLWKLPIFHLWTDENHYRIDSYRTQSHININWDPLNNGEYKGVILKFNKDIEYKYDLKKYKSTGMHPYNTPLPHQKTTDVRVIHYGKLSESFLNGEKNKMYASLESDFGGMNLNKRIKHHTECSSVKTLKLAKIKPEWIWDIL